MSISIATSTLPLSAEVSFDTINEVDAMNKNNLPLQEGTFFLGVNYWASHAGTNMWHEWDEEVVEDDFRRLKEMNIGFLRVFPLWSDFQPLKQLYAYAGAKKEVRYENEESLPFTEEGKAGVDPVMVDRFAAFCRLADKYEIRLIVSFITGWMSGRLYVPRLLESVNVLTDPGAIMWQVRFVQYMVKQFKNEKAIVAWELGNECNCLGAATREQAWTWAKAITMAVKELDSTRPMLSGMHSLLPTGRFTIQDQGEITDMLTTHPYPLFTPYCNTDPMHKMKSALHAAAESEMYAGISAKPCFPEEVGVLGPMIISDEKAADYFTASAMTAWAHNMPAYMWWCANEQTNLRHAPYDWGGIERELGVFYADHSPKPILKAMKRLQEYADAFPVELTPPVKDAVCILTREQDAWAATYGSFLLAKQAGLELRFCYAEDEIPQSDVYIMPSLATGSDGVLFYRTFLDLSERVKKGATLYISSGGAFLSGFEALTGLRPEYRMAQAHTDGVTLPDGTELTLSAPVTNPMTPTTAKTVLTTKDGQPALTVNTYGEGEVWFLNYPIEEHTAKTPNGIYEQLYKIYDLMELRSSERIAAKHDPYIGMTEHSAGDKKILVLINYEPEDKDAVVELLPGWSIEQVLPLGKDNATQTGTTVNLHISHNSGISLILKKV